MHQSSDDIDDFIQRNHQDIVFEMRKEIGNYDLVRDILQGSSLTRNLNFSEFIVALYQSIVIEQTSFDIHDVIDFITYEYLLKINGKKFFVHLYWGPKSWN